MNQDQLEDHLWSLNEKGINPVAIGTDKTGTPFLAYGWAPGGDGWDVGVVTDDTHSLEFDYTDTERCPDCGAFGRRTLEVLNYPVRVVGVDDQPTFEDGVLDRVREITATQGWAAEPTVLFNSEGAGLRLIAGPGRRGVIRKTYLIVAPTLPDAFRALSIALAAL